jgi:hypothetical protein
MSTRKLWSAMYPQIPERCRTRFESKVKAYRRARRAGLAAV